MTGDVGGLFVLFFCLFVFGFFFVVVVRFRRASHESERVKHIFVRSRGSPCRREKTF